MIAGPTTPHIAINALASEQLKPEVRYTAATPSLRDVTAGPYEVHPLKISILHYGEHFGPINLNRLSAIDERFVAFIEDFPLVSRLAEFEQFCSQEPGVRDLSLTDIRDRFDASLSPIKAYRCIGLYTAPSEREGSLYEILINGMVPKRMAQHPEENESTLRKQIAKHGLAEEIRIRVDTKSQMSFLQGITPYAEIALEGGHNHRLGEGSLVLFTLTLNALSVIRGGANGITMGSGIDKLHSDQGGRAQELPGKTWHFRPIDEQLELFVLGIIPAAAIQRVQIISKKLAPQRGYWLTRSEWDSEQVAEKRDTLPEDWLAAINDPSTDVNVVQYCRERRAVAKLRAFASDAQNFKLTHYDSSKIWYDRMRSLQSLKMPEDTRDRDLLLLELENICRAERLKDRDFRISDLAAELWNRVSGERFNGWESISPRCVSCILGDKGDPLHY